MLSEESKEEFLRLACQCRLLNCQRSLSITAAEHAAIKTEPTHRLVAPEHVSEFKREEVVIRTARYWVVKPCRKKVRRTST